MNTLSRPRHDGPLRRRWRARRWPRRPDLTARLRRGQAVDGPDWLGLLYAEQLGRELAWADADLLGAAAAAGRGE